MKCKTHSGVTWGTIILINNNNTLYKDINFTSKYAQERHRDVPPPLTARSDMQTTKLRPKINENSTPVYRKNRQLTNVNEGRVTTALTKQPTN